MRSPNPLDLAREALHEAEVEVTDAPERAALLILIAQAKATIAVAAGLDKVRESIDSIQMSLRSHAGSDAGDNLYWIQNWLKDIAERPS